MLSRPWFTRTKIISQNSFQQYSCLWKLHAYFWITCHMRTEVEDDVKGTDGKPRPLDTNTAVGWCCSWHCYSTDPRSHSLTPARRSRDTSVHCVEPKGLCVATSKCVFPLTQCRIAPNQYFVDDLMPTNGIDFRECNCEAHC